MITRNQRYVKVGDGLKTLVDCGIIKAATRCITRQLFLVVGTDHKSNNLRAKELGLLDTNSKKSCLVHGVATFQKIGLFAV